MEPGDAMPWRCSVAAASGGGIANPRHARLEGGSSRGQSACGAERMNRRCGMASWRCMLVAIARTTACWGMRHLDLVQWVSGDCRLQRRSGRMWTSETAHAASRCSWDSYHAGSAQELGHAPGQHSPSRTAGHVPWTCRFATRGSWHSRPWSWSNRGGIECVRWLQHKAICQTSHWLAGQYEARRKSTDSTATMAIRLARRLGTARP